MEDLALAEKEGKCCGGVGSAAPRKINARGRVVKRKATATAPRGDDGGWKKKKNMVRKDMM
jgi:hypothetical protein